MSKTMNIDSGCFKLFKKT